MRIIPFGPGGVGEIGSRFVADMFGRRFVIENMPSTGGIVAGRAVLAAPADGYTLLLLTGGTSAALALYNKFRLDLFDDFTPISLMGHRDGRRLEPHHQLGQAGPRGLGSKEFAASSCNSLCGKAGSPPEIIAMLDQATTRRSPAPGCRRLAGARGEVEGEYAGRDGGATARRREDMGSGSRLAASRSTNANPEETTMSNASPLSLAEIDARIAIVRDNIRQLIEQAAARSGAEDEALNADRIAKETEELERLTKQRDALLQR